MVNYLSFNDPPEAVARLSSQLDRMESQMNALMQNYQPTSKEEDRKLTLSEAADYCRMAVPTFRLYLRRREVSGSKLGKFWLFTKNDLDAFLERYKALSVDQAQTHCQTIRRIRRTK